MDSRQKLYEEQLAKEPPAVRAVVSQLLGMSNGDRMDAFYYFCTSCGDNNPRCQCWNDE